MLDRFIDDTPAKRTDTDGGLASQFASPFKMPHGAKSLSDNDFTNPSDQSTNAAPIYGESQAMQLLSLLSSDNRSTADSVKPVVDSVSRPPGDPAVRLPERSGVMSMGPAAGIPTDKLTIENIDLLFDSALVRFDEDRNHALDKAEIEKGLQSQYNSPADKQLLSLLRDNTQTLGNLSGKMLFFNESDVTRKDIIELQKLSNDGTGSMKSIGRIALDRLSGTEMILSAGVMYFTGFGGTWKASLAIAAGATALLSAARTTEYLVNQKAKVQTLLDSMEMR